MNDQPTVDEDEGESRGSHDRLKEIVDILNKTRRYRPVEVEWAAQLLDAVDRWIITGELPE